jgi:hypothetical protein
MSKWWVWISIIIFITIALILVWTIPQSKFAVLNFITPKDNRSRSLPSELNQDFNPSINEPRFNVIGIGSKVNSFQLEYSFPPSLVGQKIESQINCSKGLYIRERGQTKLKKVNMEYVLPKIIPENMPILLTGLCKDKDCQSIVGKCGLYLN